MSQDRKRGINAIISMVEKTKEKSTEKVHFIVRAIFVTKRIKRVVQPMDRQKGAKLMQIVIDIPKEMYENALNNLLCGSTTLCNAIKNGTPLPKGHGRLIDADRLLRPDMIRMCYHLKNGDTAMPIIDIEHAETVIPADKEEINPYEKCKTCGQNRESCCGCPDVLKLEQKIRGMQNDRDISR